MKRYFDPDLIILTLISIGEMAHWPHGQKKHSIYFQQMLDSICRHYDIDTYTPLRISPRIFRKSPVRVKRR